nr:DUF4982 domain-containing protein [Prevotella sp.]
MYKRITELLFMFLFTSSLLAMERTKTNFNGNWLLQVGDFSQANKPEYNDKHWEKVTLPHAFNEAEAFKVAIADLTDTVMWYRKHFNVAEIRNRKFFIEFEGVRFGAEIWLNGKSLGITENGVMASGFELTPYIKEGENVIAVRVDNSWKYRERSSNSPYQWNDKNFNANYGGITKNVFLYSTDLLYQTLPLYSNLGTTGTYIYGTDYDIKGGTMTFNAQTQVKNEDHCSRTFTFVADVMDKDNKPVAHYKGKTVTLQPGETENVTLKGDMHDVHFWSWGYGYLYNVKTSLLDEGGTVIDVVNTRTGFRKTHFGEGKIWLNDRVMMVHGYAQRTSNEWPGVGMGVPAWLSDYSNDLMVQSGGNMVRWMHVTPWKQDVESCGRVGLPMAMPAGDAEKDVEGRRWQQRTMLMRDAIIYNRNNPSILFYEGGNESISKEHVIELKKIRDDYDPFGGRAVGSREMLDIDESEYGGEMLYVNKSKTHPMWAMEYDRDEGLRKYWDEQSYPYHKDGFGPLYRGKPAMEYNHNMDELVKSMVARWNDFFIERPGTGTRVNSGGVKIVFSDTNTHCRGEVNYRTSGVTDAMRIPKDAYFAHKVMWDGWVEPEKESTYIVGHWNYDKGIILNHKYVVSTGDDVELFLNGKSLGKGERSDTYLFTFKNIPFEEGTLEAVSYKSGKVVSRYSIETAGKADHVKLTVLTNPEGFKADGADMALIQIEVVDKEGRRCPFDNRMIHFNQSGEGQWIGGIAVRRDYADKLKQLPNDNIKGVEGKLPDYENRDDNYVRSLDLPVECGVNRVLVRSTVNPGVITVVAGSDSLKPAFVTLNTEKVDIDNYLPQNTLQGSLKRGETPLTPSYKDIKKEVDISYATCGSNAGVSGSNDNTISNSFDDNELTEWKSDGKKENAVVSYHLKEKAKISEIAMKLTGWRSKMYPLEIYEGKKLVWSGLTYPTLGYVHIPIINPIRSDIITIKMTGPSMTKAEKSDTKEVAGGKAGDLDSFTSVKGSVELRIVEIDFYGDI